MTPTLDMHPRYRTTPARRHKPGRFPRRRRRGFSLIETLLVVGVLAVVLVAILALYRTVQENVRTSQFSYQMAQLIGGLERAYANASAYDPGNLVPTLDGGGDIPIAARRQSGTNAATIENPFGGAVTIVGTALTGATATFKMTKIPQSACVRFLESYVGLGAKNTNLISTKVGTVTLASPVTRATITSGCKSGDNTIELTF